MRYWNNGPVWPQPDPTQDVPWQTSRMVPREVSEEAWKEYAAQGHGDQDHQRIIERQGFAAVELAILLFQRIKRLERSLEKGRQQCTGRNGSQLPCFPNDGPGGA